MASGTVRLIGDIGGTNARLAIAIGGKYQQEETYLTERYSGLDGAIEAFVKTLPDELKPQEAAVAIAGPIHGDEIRLTNSHWHFSRRDLAKQFGFGRMIVVNDFTANALALPYLGPDDAKQVGGGSASDSAPIGILGPGTGLGVSGLIRSADRQHVALTGEGGHVTMSAADPEDAAILAELAKRIDHLSAERVLSGEGLVNIYDALCALARREPQKLAPADITDPESQDELRIAAVNRFCAMLGTVAGNLALTLGAEGGVYIAGGIVPRLGERFTRSDFRRRFEAKGRMQPYLARIPTFVITHPKPAFVGLARLPDA
ncbi:MAG: glucokinase [Aliidongia sp.]